jgi:DNA-binding transcriptional LysR family regulator
MRCYSGRFPGHHSEVVGRRIAPRRKLGAERKLELRLAKRLCYGSWVDFSRINPGLLYTFLVVAEAGQISQAARRLHLSQPAVTAQIRRLESDLNTPLFIRSVHGVALTPPAVRLRERLQTVFEELEKTLQELDQTEELTGVLHFAASTTSAAHFVPSIFIRFRHYYPEVGLRLIVGNAEEILEHVREQRVGLGLLGGHDRSPGVRLEPFMPDEIIPVCGAQVPDPKLRREIAAVKSARDLERLPLIWREQGAGTRAVVEEVLKESGLNVRKLDQGLEIGSTEAIKSLVIAGLGVAFFSCWEIQNELASGAVREIDVPGLRIHGVFSWAIPSGELGGLPGEFYRFANSIRNELSAVSVRTWRMTL